ncbi:hypothetical protein PV396_21135 [Streptomyces sp. ME02-8801-2C]|uniref:hypothetical protein n=1 Tax=Streptomyces sp. ME02-8801-2C TaxID=3028680 RepID=UPI0029B1D654|nr:hypothetical protein [Streptomyces sp. ME02-8801-2C]MDX3454418.1 hypothetical protein [Streptomyces sp. ME02-8801-2C]
MSKAQSPSGHAPVFGLITPEDWYRIPLQPRERREASVSALIRRQFAGVDDQPILRRKAEEQLLDTAGAGVEQGGVVLYLSFLEVSGIPLSASLLVSHLHQKFDSLDAVAALAGSGEVQLTRLPAGRAARLVRRERSKQSRKLGSEFEDTVVEYFVPVPDRDEVLMLTFSTPLEPIADAMVGLFDAVAGTLRWQKVDRAEDSAEDNGEKEEGWASD